MNNFATVLSIALIATTATGASRTKSWHGKIDSRPGDEKFQRIHCQSAMLYHENGCEVIRIHLCPDDPIDGRGQPPFSPPPVRPLVLSTAFTPKANS